MVSLLKNIKNHFPKIFNFECFNSIAEVKTKTKIYPKLKAANFKHNRWKVEMQYIWTFFEDKTTLKIPSNIKPPLRKYVPVRLETFTLYRVMSKPRILGAICQTWISIIHHLLPRVKVSTQTGMYFRKGGLILEGIFKVASSSKECSNILHLNFQPIT